MTEQTFDSTDKLNMELAKAISGRLQAAITDRGKATLVVSGGSTPRPLFAQLAAADIPWKNVTVLLADERWVSETHADSNSAMVKSLLLQGEAAAATWIDFGAGQEDADAEVARVAEILSAMDSFDVVVLGMGADSHTASLFPCSIELPDGLSTTSPVLMTQPTTAPHRRISLSKDRLLKTELGIIHLVGESKLEVYEKATAHADDDIHPISHFAHHDQFSLWFAP